MSFECLPDELVLDIFEYINAIDIFRAFHGLNCRIDHLLYISFKHYHLDLRHVSKYNFTNICQHNLLLIIDKIVTLNLSDDDETPNILENFLSYHFTIDKFTHLKSLCLQSIHSLDLLNGIILQCHSLSYLTRLEISQCLFNSDSTTDLINNIWTLPCLIKCNLDGIQSMGADFSKFSATSSSIKYLSIKSIPCTCFELSCIFQRTPNLQKICTALEVTDKNEKFTTTASFLTDLDLSFNGSAIAIVSLLKKMVNLRSLTLTTSCILLNGHEWENIFVQYLPNLRNFRLRMDFKFPKDAPIEKEVNTLLNTYKTKFWTTVHQWFVRCDWSRNGTAFQLMLYTLPYAFDDFNYVDESWSKSTCFDTRDHWLYDSVRTLQYNNNTPTCLRNSLIQFSKISHLEIFLPFNENLLRNIPSLHYLRSLSVALLPGDSVYKQLQMLLDRAPRLRLLRFSHLTDLDTILFEFKNPSVHRLDFFIKESMIYNWYLNKEQCITLANSTLGRQCQILLIDIKNRANVNDLIDNMPNLQTLIFHCKDDKSYRKASSPSVKDELVQWLEEHLPPTCLISRNKHQNSILQVWIR